MLFVTNRVLNQGPTRLNSERSYILPRSVSFNLEDNQAGQSVSFCYRTAANNYTEIGSQTFFRELRNSDFKQIVLYLHGFNSFPEPDIFPAAEEIQALFDQKSPGYIIVVPLIWPCDSDFGVVQDYYDDQISADASGYAFLRFLEKFLAWRNRHSTLENPCIKRINILAHSMGNRVLRSTLACAVKYEQTQGMPLIFRNTFMIAPDIINETFEPGESGSYIPPSSRNVVVYYAADDLALRASKVANARDTSRRLGHTGPENIKRVAKNVYAFDCGDFNNSYDQPVGHSYFRKDPQGNPGIVFNHIWDCINTGRVPITPPGSQTQIL